ncbi:AAA family ATPase [Candidatus Margulisiibacteriota bacterium]
MKNPFNPRYPVDPKYFVGRKAVLNGLERDFRFSFEADPPKPENVALVGEWGIGKTSALNKFYEIINQHKGVLPIFVSLTTYKDFSYFVKDFINQVYRAISESKSVSTKTKEDIFSWKIKSLKLGPISAEKEIKEFTGLSASEQLRACLLDLWKEYIDGKFKLVILMLDDFHHVVKIARESLYDLRAIFQGLPRYACNYQLLITGSPDMFGEIRNLAEPLVRFFEKYELTPFSYKETQDEIKKPIKQASIPISINQDVIDKIYKLSMGHPFFIAFIMRDLIELKKRGKIDAVYFDKKYSSIFNHLRKDKFEKDLDSASENERKILFNIAKLNSEEIRPNDIKANVKNVRMYLSSLVTKNLISKLGRGRYKLYHPLFGEYLRNI